MRKDWRAAPDYFRCGARTTLSDGTHAACMKWRNDGYFRNPNGPGSVCTQHGNMIAAGKTVYRFFDNAVMRFRVDSR